MSQFSSVRYGSKPVQSIYLGSKLIWPVTNTPAFSIPQPTVRYSFHDSDENWQIGAGSVASAVSNFDAQSRVTLAGYAVDTTSGSFVATMSSTADQTNLQADGTMVVESGRAIGTSMDWTLAGRTDADRLQMSIRVDGPAAQYAVKLSTYYLMPGNSSLSVVTSTTFTIPTGYEYQLETRIVVNTNVPSNVLTMIQNLKVTVIDSLKAGGTVTMHLNNIQQAAALDHYGPDAYGVATSFFASPPSGLPDPVISDSFINRAVQMLTGAHDWSVRNNRAMHIGEWSWPGEDANSPTNSLSASQTSYQNMADMWMRQADRLAIPFTSWGESSYWGGNDNTSTGAQNYGSYPMAHYYATGSYGQGVRPVSRAKPTAVTFENHLNTVPGRFVGINIVGMCFTYNKTDGNDDYYANTHHGTVNSDYVPEVPATIDYLYGRGIRYFRLSYRWDRVMPTIGAPLDDTEWGYVQTMIDYICTKTDAVVIVDSHDSGAYATADPSTGLTVRNYVDGNTGLVKTADFVDYWNKISDKLNRPQYQDKLIYELANEPKDGFGTAFNVQRYTQAVLSSLRARGDDTFVLIPLYPYDNIITSIQAQNHPYAWIVDPAGSRRHAYTFHHYMDGQLSGSYALTYDAEVKATNSVGNFGTYSPVGGPVHISWADPTYALNSPSSYQIWLGTIDGSNNVTWSQIDSVSNVHTYDFSGLTANTAYYFGVTAIYADGTLSNRASVKVTAR